MNNTFGSIVVSLDRAKRLKEAGYPQKESLLYWQWYEDDGESMFGNFPSEWQCYQMEGSYDDYEDGECFAAPTAEEILKMLPDSVDSHVLIVQHFLEQWHVQYMQGNAPYYVESNESLANAAAAMYCYLSDNT